MAVQYVRPAHRDRPDREPHMPQPPPESAAPLPPCSSCHGVGSIVMSLCCGRGCPTCPGDGMLEAVSCYSCQGTGTLTSPPAAADTAG